MTTSINIQATGQTASTALQAKLQKAVDELGSKFGDALAQILNDAAQQAEPTANTAKTMAATDAAGASSTAQATQATGSTYLLDKTADHAARQSGKPDTAAFMQATGADFSTASSLLYGVIGSNTDYRDWNAIMGSSNPLQAARQATGALYGSDLPYTNGQGFKPGAGQTIAAAGNYAWLKVDSREGLWLMNNQGEALRQLPANAPGILRASRDFGVDTTDLAALADQMATKGASHPGVDLRDLARGGMGTAHDWTTDALAHLKGPGAQEAVAADALLAQELGLARGTVTTNPGTNAKTNASATTNTNTSTGSVTTAAVGVDSTATTGTTASAEALAQQLTDTLLAQLQATLQGWQTRTAASVDTTQRS